MIQLSQTVGLIVTFASFGLLYNLLSGARGSGQVDLCGPLENHFIRAR